MTTFDVFLSHNSKDKPVVRELAEALRARGLKVWLDEWELVPGRPWQEALEEIIETTSTAAVLIGPHGFGRWEVPEMRAAVDEFIRRRLPVIPVPLPDAPEEPDLPLFVRGFTWVDFRGDGITEITLDRLEWGITGQVPKRKAVTSEKHSEKIPKAHVSVNSQPMHGIALKKLHRRGWRKNAIRSCCPPWLAVRLAASP